MQCRKYHLHKCNRDSHLHNYNNNCHPHIRWRNCHLHLNCIIATEIVTSLIATKRSINTTVKESTTCMIAMQPQDLHNCNRLCHLHNCYRKCQFHSSNRNCHLQNWLQKLSLAEMVPMRDSFSYSKEIELMSKHQV